MKALVDIVDKKILMFNEKEVVVWGVNDDIQFSGRAVWKTFPNGADRMDLIIDANGDVVVDQSKKATKESKKQAKAERLERLKNYDGDAAGTIAQLKPIVRDLLAEICDE